MNSPYTYPGQELLFFEKAVNWKKYFGNAIRPFIGSRVLEAGSGIGATTIFLNDGSAKQWVLMEPDGEMNTILQKKIKADAHFANCVVTGKSIFQLDGTQLFNTIIYIDVLEHIEDDKKELEQAANLLEINGYLIVLSPAFPFLFSAFDAAIGHYRRYNSAMLQKIIPPTLAQVQIRYLDSVGFFASLANKMFLQQNYPTQKQITMWDKWMIPISKYTDHLFFHSFGKTILGIWKKK